LWDRPIVATAITYDTAINDTRTKAHYRSFFSIKKEIPAPSTKSENHRQYSSVPSNSTSVFAMKLSALPI
jgi:hypothetical protein